MLNEPARKRSDLLERNKKEQIGTEPEQIKIIYFVKLKLYAVLFRSVPYFTYYSGVNPLKRMKANVKCRKLV